MIPDFGMNLLCTFLLETLFLSLARSHVVIGQMWQIVWEDWKKGDVQSDCLVSVDGTDCRIPMQRQALHFSVIVLLADCLGRSEKGRCAK
jgi:hypothetical protein